jgi:hypothetical protein
VKKGKKKTLLFFFSLFFFPAFKKSYEPGFFPAASFSFFLRKKETEKTASLEKSYEPGFFPAASFSFFLRKKETEKKKKKSIAFFKGWEKKTGN